MNNPKETDAVPRPNVGFPSIDLQTALTKVLQVYEEEGKNSIRAEAVASRLGYSSMNNGAAQKAIATLRQYGLLDRPQVGHLAVNRSVEAYRYALDDNERASILRRWLQSSPAFAALLSKFPESLPSQDALKRTLIMDFDVNKDKVDAYLRVFLSSVQFAGFYSQTHVVPQAAALTGTPGTTMVFMPPRPASATPPVAAPVVASALDENHDAGLEKIPVRLGAGRRAYLLVPSDLYLADKERMKAQIDILLAQDEE